MFTMKAYFIATSRRFHSPLLVLFFHPKGLIPLKPVCLRRDLEWISVELWLSFHGIVPYLISKVSFLIIFILSRYISHLPRCLDVLDNPLYHEMQRVQRLNSYDWTKLPRKMCFSFRLKCAVCGPRSFISRWDHRRLKRRNFSETSVTGCCNRGTRPLFSSALSQFHRWLLQSNYEYAVQQRFYGYFVLLLRLEHHECRHRTII